MADDPATGHEEVPQTEPATEEPRKEETDDEKLGEEGVKALEAFKKRARQAERVAKDLEAKVKEFEDRDKSEAEKQQEQTEALKTRAEKAEGQLLRYRVATTKGLPLELAERLQGTDEKELQDDADRLAELVKQRPSNTDVDAGKGDATEGVSLNDMIRAQAGR